MSTRIMFWNIQNAWDVSVTTPEELAAYLLIDARTKLYGDFLQNARDPDVWIEAASALVTGKRARLDRTQAQAAIDEWQRSPERDAQAQLAALIELASKHGTLLKDLVKARTKASICAYDAARGEVCKSRREWIVDIVRRIAPRILIVVEPATTKKQINFCLEHQGAALEGIRALSGEQQDVGGVWVAYQLAVSLGPKWQCWASPINSTAAWIRQRKVESKNSFFELYTLLWDGESGIQLGSDGGFLPGKYPERAPYWLRARTPGGELLLVFTHAVFGNVAERKQTLQILAQDLAGAPFADDPVIVMGDFNLDYGSKQNRALYDALGMGPSLANGVKSTFMAARTARPDAYTKNAYDQIFIRRVPKVLGGGIYDFAEHVFQLRQASKTTGRLTFKPFEEIVKVSDHLPAWCEVGFR